MFIYKEQIHRCKKYYFLKDYQTLTFIISFLEVGCFHPLIANYLKCWEAIHNNTDKKP